MFDLIMLGVGLFISLSCLCISLYYVMCDGDDSDV